MKNWSTTHSFKVVVLVDDFLEFRVRLRSLVARNAQVFSQSDDLFVLLRTPHLVVDQAVCKRCRFLDIKNNDVIPVVNNAF